MTCLEFVIIYLKIIFTPNLRMGLTKQRTCCTRLFWANFLHGWCANFDILSFCHDFSIKTTFRGICFAFLAPFDHCDQIITQFFFDMTTSYPCNVKALAVK